MEAPVAGRLIGDNVDSDSTESRERRRGSGSFMGAEESDEEIAFRGSARDRLGEFRVLPRPRICVVITETSLRRVRWLPEAGELDRASV